LDGEKGAEQEDYGDQEGEEQFGQEAGDGYGEEEQD